MKKILFITDGFGTYNTGAAIYSYGVIYRLSNYFKIDVICNSAVPNNNDEYVSAIYKKISKCIPCGMGKSDLIKKYFLYRTTFPRYSQSLIQSVKNALKGAHYEYVFVDHLRMAYVIPILKKYHCKVILVEHNVEFENYKEQIAISKSLKYKVKNIGLPRYEAKILKFADFIWLFGHRRG